ncbi:hypothetical protein RDI58_003557 [Solanum bulbocastanum]|uniref:Uncharacterized protein n=1 Tax=Solanum bulbocastanum TaxID=147425 RepID=A0AAN8YV46_SOLBU
MMMIIPLSKM